MWKNIKNFIVMQPNILNTLKKSIPNSFKVGGSTFYINIVENSEKDLNGALGDCTNLLHQIRVAKTCRVDEDVINIPDDEFDQIIKRHIKTEDFSRQYLPRFSTKP